MNFLLQNRNGYEKDMIYNTQNIFVQNLRLPEECEIEECFEIYDLCRKFLKNYTFFLLLELSSFKFCSSIFLNFSKIAKL